MKMRAVTSPLLVVMLLMISAACKRIPLYERTTKVNLVVDLDRDLGHDIVLSYETDLEDEYVEKIEGMVPTYYEVLVYDIENHDLVSSHVVGEKGGPLSLNPGSYHLVLYSFGTESTQVGDLHHRLEAEAFTTDITEAKSHQFRSRAPKNAVKSSSKAYEDDPIIHEPDHLYVANEMDVTIEAFMGVEEEVTVYTTASSIMDVYSLEVLNVKGVENIEKVEAFVTGQVISNHFGKQERNMSPATLYVNMSTDVANSRLYTVFNTFGKMPGEDNQIFLDVTVTNSDGGQYRYVFDVTDQFEDPENTDHQLIMDGGEIDIPEPEVGGGGFSPSVDEWENENIDVPLS